MANAAYIKPIAPERALLWCVLASIALHALVLLGLSWGGAPAPPVKTLLVLTARLAPIAAAPQTPARAPQPERPPPQATDPVSLPRPALTKPLASSAAAVQETAPAEPAKGPAPESAPASSRAADTGARPAVAVLTRPVPQSAVAAPGVDAATRSGNEADKGSLDQYRLALIVATRRYKRYPAIAMEKGWQGRVEVHMVIGADGMIASASIKSGSGHDILDQQALEMLQKGKTTVSIPANLRGREFSIDIPVIFNLDDPNNA